ncbi:MAG: hypothetical protein H0W25_00055 [Acidimicrobiia bacterium]|nr:hypothetical protein [Acidimicrobiia bacterium]
MSDPGGDDDDRDDLDEHDGPAPAAAAPRTGSGRLTLVGAGLAVVVAATLAYLLGQRGSAPQPTAATGTTITTEPASTTTSGLPGDLIQFEDADSGVSLSYPATWERLDPPPTDPSVVLVLSAGGQDSALVRTVELADAVTTENLADMNAVTDGIIAGAGVNVLRETEIELNGMPGYYYLYLFDDAVTGEQGVHAHYFLFQGRVMNILVLQAVPTERFDLLAPAFDALSSSFRSAPPAVGPTTSTTLG